MAVDTQKLFYLLDPVFQIENLAGKPVVGGHIEVFVAGTDTKYITWQDWGGARNPFKIPLKSDGRAVILVEPQYTYDVYVYDSFNNMVCSRLNVSPAIGGDVSVSGLTQVFHDDTISGNGTPQEPIGVVSAGKVYEGIEPIVVNNDLDKISANHVSLGVQDPLYFVQDDEEGCIIGFSGQTVPEGVMTESALGFENNKITGYNGSAFSAGNEYEAGNYISIDDNVINVTGLSPVPTDTASTGLVAQVSADIVSQIPSTAGLATTAQLNEKLDKSDSAKFYPMNSNPSGYLTGLPSDLATTGWVDSQGYLTAVDIPESAVWNATTQTVSANSAQWAGGTANPQIPVTGINGIKISESGDKVVFEVSGDYATEDWVTGQGYLTAETDWTNTITAASANAYNEATAAIPAPFDPTYLSGQIDNKLDSAIYAEDSGKFLTALPSDLVYTADIQDMTTTGDLTAYATVESLTAKQDAGNYLSATDSANFLLTSDSGNFYTTANESGFITGVDLTPYQLTADMTAYQPVGDYLTTADSANFYTTANESGYLTAVPDTYLQNTDLTITDGKVTEISGVPLSAGDELPSGVMNTSALEYNAVNEISGYNGSAIAQYGAEKQFIVHDDTLVHLSNSAQYALGVNLSALQRLMGIDETVLYSGTATTSCTLTESPSDFDRVRFYGYRNEGSPANSKGVFEFPTDGVTGYDLSQLLYDNGCNYRALYLSRYAITGTNCSLEKAQHLYAATGNIAWQGQGTCEILIYKVIGIGRISG